MQKNKQTLLQELSYLMSKQGAWQSDYPAIPFYKSEQEFGINMAPFKGSLYAMHHLIDSLNMSDFFEGERAKGTDLDSMMCMNFV